MPAPADERTATRGAIGWGTDSFVVLYAGRIGREKGVDVLVKAFARLHAEHPGCELAVVGSASLGDDPEDSERFAAELRALAEGLPVTWLPARRDIVELIQAADVAVAPSLWPEPLSRSVMEPLCCGIPVVASRVGGNPELLTDWLADFLVDVGDDAGLANRLATLDGWRARDPDSARAVDATPRSASRLRPKSMRSSATSPRPSGAVTDAGGEPIPAVTPNREGRCRDTGETPAGPRAATTRTS